ncbi:MAG: AAA family ATPase [Aigarchaeota archaeon]|nr:AAA family ATPase [Aigarchaeota archaeon]MDW8093076.1 AAA family ATPase [Nitrososphaerota archaeon]
MFISLKLPIVEKVPLLKLKLSRDFSTRVKFTKRVAAVADAFGLGLDEERRFIVYKDFELEVFPGDVIFVTGESGSGKSILLRELARALSEDRSFGRVLEAGSIEIDPNEVLIHGVGRDVSDAIEKLSMAGLNEAALFIRRYKELSDGQRYRYRIARLLDSDAGVWVLDEFASTLDRDTAKVVAYLLQKVARKRGKTVLVATTHDDVLYDLNPTLLIRKKFGEVGAEIKRLSCSPRTCSLISSTYIARGDMNDYKALERFHYLSRRPGYVTDVFKAVYNGDVVGVIVYTMCSSVVSGRFTALPWLKRLYVSDRRGYYDFLGREFRRIARVVVAPKFRGIGLGVRLVRETLPRVGVKYVETLAVMARYNPFFEHAGMRRVSENPPLYQEASKWFAERGFDLSMMASKRYNLSVLRRMDEGRRREVYDYLVKVFGYFKSRKKVMRLLIEGGPDLDLMAEALKMRPLPTVYLIWERGQDVKNTNRAVNL